MVQVLKSVIEDIGLYNNNRFLIPLFLIALIILWVIEKEKSIRNVLVYLTSALIVIFLCPLFAFIGNKIDDEIYYRVWWTIPMGMIFCFAMIKIMFMQKEFWRKAVVMALAVIIIVTNGRLVYTNSLRFPRENKYCIPQASVDVANYVTFEYASPVIIAAPEIMMYIRQYNSNVQVPFSRFYFGDLKLQDQELFDAINNPEEYNTDVICNAAMEHQVLYVVLNALIPLSDEMEDYGFTFQTWLDGYNIYRYEQLYDDYVKYGAIKK